MPERVARDADRSIASSSLSWGVKESLRDYVEGLDDGRIDWIAPATEARFPCASVAHETDAQALTFVADGAVRFVGHDGLMDVTLRGIAARVADETLVLSIAGRTDAAPVPIVEQMHVRTELAEREMVITADAPELTSRGAAVLGGFYPRGTVLDPIRLVIAW